MVVSAEPPRLSAEYALKSLIAGGIAGMCAKTTVAPLDRVKILFQAHNHHYQNLGILSTIQKIIQKERFLDLYKGNGVQMIRIFPYAAIQFSFYEQYKMAFSHFLGIKSHFPKLLAGSAAGMTAVTLTYPLDVIRTRFAFQVKGEHKYFGIKHAFRTIYTQEGGLRGLYKGYIPTIFGMVPYAGLSFLIFEYLKTCCMEYAPVFCCDTCVQNSGGLVLKLPAKLLCGGIAGAVAQTAVYPLDVVRRQMQLYTMLPNSDSFRNVASTLDVVFQKHGIIRGLYRGLSINYIRAIPMVAVSFTTYEVMKQTFNLDTGISS